MILGLKHDLVPSAVLKVLWKELRISLCLAAVLSLVAGIEGFMIHGQGTPEALRFGGAVTVAMALHVMTAAVLGALIPLGVAAAGRDPSMVAHPALATVADLSGTVIYFTTLSRLLSL